MQEGFGKDAPATQVQTHAGLDQYIEGAQGVSSPKQVPDAQGASLPQDAELSSGWVNFDTGETLSPLAAFLSHAALEAGDNQAQAGQDAVQLMTVHAAKGLEFDCVFITGLEEGLFPHENSLSSVEGLEEERRLMYVALTRARKRLYLSHAQTRMLHGQTRFNMRSRFFDEMPEVTPVHPIRGTFHQTLTRPLGAALRTRVRENQPHKRLCLCVRSKPTPVIPTRG